MDKTREGRGKVLTSVASLLFIVLVAVGFLWASYFLNARFTTQAIRSGEMVLNSPKDIDKYFVFLSADEAASALEKKGGKGKASFLFPQIDFVFGEGPIIIKQEKTSIEGRDIDFVTFSGLNIGTRVYLGEDGVLRGAMAPEYIWFTERSESRTSFAKTTYVAASPILGGLLLNIGDIYSFFPAQEPIASLNVRTEMTSPIKSQIAVYISDGERDDYATFSNMLRSRGKFVLVQGK